MNIFDPTPCYLGEGALWHPQLRRLFWFDIGGRTLYCRNGNRTDQWVFEDEVSAAGWIDSNSLLIASSKALLRFKPATGESTHLVPLEADNPVTRSNDGRADPWGGFWISTIGRNEEYEAGSLYRFFKGRLALVRSDLTIPNSICFSPDRRFLYYSDTALQTLWRLSLDSASGWPDSQPEVFLDLTGTAGGPALNPDGAVCDATGNLWIACWGASQVAGFDSSGDAIATISAPAEHMTCPAFGGMDYRTLFATSARKGLSEAQLAAQPAGATFYTRTDIQGVPEYQVKL